MTLGLGVVLHAFTHAYGTLLVPLYLLIQKDLNLPGTSGASLIVTIYGLVYCIGSFPAGVFADGRNRKALLGIGLIGNAAAIMLMGFTRQYEMILGLAVVAGIFGTLFHPAANALMPEHYPKSPGMTIGLLGIGSGVGFFVGPQYAGWRAQSGHWQLWHVADWQRPCVEMGLGGIVFGLLFLLIAREVRDRVSVRVSQPSGQWSLLRPRVLAIAATLAFRDFAGVATLTLSSVYLQKAHHYTVEQTGFVVGTMMLLSSIANPFAVYFTPGRRRLPALAVVLVMGGAILMLVPFVKVRFALLVLAAFQTCQMASYAISDSGMLERVAPSVRGRVVGLFLSVAGTFASLSPWAMGAWTDLLKERALEPLAYVPLFVTLGVMMIVAASSAPLIARLGRGTPGISAMSEVMPGTMEMLG